MSGTLKNYYETLGVPRSATADQIRTAYRKLLLKFHPDKNVGDPYFEDWSKKVIEAFEVLIDPQVRAEYDQVYDATRNAFRQATTKGKTSAAATDQAETARQDISPEKDETGQEATVRQHAVATLENLAPDFIAARKEEIRADRNLKELQERVVQLGRQKAGYRKAMIASGILGAAVLIWLLVSLLTALVIQQAPQEVTADQPAPAGATATQPARVQRTSPTAYGQSVTLQARVVVPKAYFHHTPEDGTVTEAFLSEGNKINISRKSDDYYYAVFQSISHPDYRLEGWIRVSQLEILP
ncbi:hypothetical protein GCM10027051_15200 [Niabella terrae]